MIKLSRGQEYYYRLIQEKGTGVILFDDTSTVVVSIRDCTCNVPTVIPFKIFEQLEFIGCIRFEREIGRDQYYYELKELK